MEKIEFKPFDKVLVRDDSLDRWHVNFFEEYTEGDAYPYVCLSCCWKFCIPYNDDTKHLLGTTDDYEEPYKPNDGDFVTSKKGYPFIYKPGKTGKCDYYVGLTAMGLRIYDKHSLPECFCSLEGCCPAKEEEKNLILSRLHEVGKDWDAEKKEIVDYKWIPKEGEHIYALWMSPVELQFFYEGTTFVDSKIMQKGFSKGLVCRTEEEAKNRCKELNDRLTGNN